MPRMKTSVTVLFKEVTSASKKGPRMKCRFCCAEVAKNGTRMEKHIANCKNCDDGTKYKYLTENKLYPKSSTETTSAAELPESLDEPDDIIDITETSSSPPKKVKKSTMISQYLKATSQDIRSQSPVVSPELE